MLYPDTAFFMGNKNLQKEIWGNDKTDRYVECSAAGMKYRLIPVTDEIIRCMIAKDEVKTEQESLIIEKKSIRRFHLKQQKQTE